ncbi:MAG: electron transfer flavoprotein subunit alpha, partial [Dehalococcoidia bacterium]|nr:electron transfer flavoprotein subunit alpha [Dehalococcoidia bacterium]
MAEYKGVIIFGEVTNGKLASITAELLGCGRNFADELKEDLCCLLVSDEVGETAPRDAIAFGADKVYTVEDSLLKEYQGETYIQVVERLAKELSPRVILMGQTPVGRDLAPRLAFRLGTG